LKIQYPEKIDVWHPARIDAHDLEQIVVAIFAIRLFFAVYEKISTIQNK
jgi:hypothetical protein